MIKARSKAFSIVLSLLSIVALAGIDQLLKYLVETMLKPISSVTVIENVLALTYVQNDGAMMGMLKGSAIPMAVVSAGILIALITFIAIGKLNLGVPYFCLIAIAGGGVGNVIDRIFRGYVVDYIEALFVEFYVFNFADMLITCACIVLVIYELYTAFRDMKASKRSGDA